MRIWDFRNTGGLPSPTVIKSPDLRRGFFMTVGKSKYGYKYPKWHNG
jgi:hypothetical protein